MKALCRISFELIMLIVLFNPHPILSNSLLGADITWQSVGEDSIIVKLTLYRDCNGTDMSNAAIDITCKSTGVLIAKTSATRPNPVDITPTCDQVCTRCCDPNSSFIYGMQEFVYTTGIIDLSAAGNCCEILMSYKTCCRTSYITSGLANKSFLCEAMMNRCIVPRNNSPFFTNPPRLVICNGQFFVMNYGVQDYDKDTNGGLSDSLVYEWTSPLDSSGNSLNYNYMSSSLGFGFWGMPINSLLIPRGFHLDERSGQIMFTPIGQVVSVLALKIKEYRNGNHIGSITRDVQMIVTNCPTNSSPTLPGMSSRYFHTATGICSNDSIISIQGSGYNPIDTLTLFWNNGLEGGVWSDSMYWNYINSRIGMVHWSPNDSQISNMPPTFTVTAEDNACPIKGTSTVGYRVIVMPAPEPNITYSGSCGNYTFSSGLSSNDLNYIWTGTGGINSNDSVFTYKFDTFGVHTFSLAVFGKLSGSCSSITFDTIFVDTFLKGYIVESDTHICFGDQITLHSIYLGNKGPVSYNWSTNINDTLQATTFVPNKDTVVYLSISDTGGCTVIDSIKIDIHNHPTVILGSDKNICDGDSILITAQYQIDQGSLRSINWYNGGNIFDSNLAVMLSDSGLYVCDVIDTFGCVGYDTIIIKIQSPFINLGNDILLCSEDTAIFNAGSGFATYHWSNGDTAQTLVYPYFGINDSIVSVTITDKYGCSAKDTVIVLQDSNCVWPGDANKDEIANLFDILPIGIGYGFNGTIRQNASSVWDGQPAINWMNTYANGVNYKHADCDGNGTINLFDLSAIIVNYGKTYSRSGNNGQDTDPVIMIDVPDNIPKGEIINCPVELGTHSKQVDSLYGIVFTIGFDGQLIDTASIFLDFKNSWIGNDNLDMIYFYKTFDNTVDVAITRIDQQNINRGYGSIGTFNFSLKDDIAGEQTLITRLEMVKAISNNEKEISLFAVSDSGSVNTATSLSGPGNNIKESIFIYPNPTKGKIFLKSRLPLNGRYTFKIINVFGHEIGNYSVSINHSIFMHEIEFTGYPNGVYFILISSDSFQRCFQLLKF